MQSEQQMIVRREWQPSICHENTKKKKADRLSACSPQVRTRATTFKYEPQSVTEATPNWDLLKNLSKKNSVNIQSVDFHFIF